MSKWLRRLGWTLFVVLAAGVPAYYGLCVEGAMPGDADFALDLGEVRQLANSLEGSKPDEVRFENVAAFQFSEAMVQAGDPWKKTPMPVYSYQLVYPDKTLIIDSAMDRSLAIPEVMVPMFDEAAYQTVSRALEQAALIVVTHEHSDHIGGLVNHPRLAALLPALRITEEQLAYPNRMKPAAWRAEALQGYRPLHYDRLLALAPGVVLIKAPGHTPGSQMVYVRLADGRELLFLGDVAWHMRNVQTERERPRFMTLLIQEDRRAVFGQLKALHRLAQTDPGVKLVPGHDGAVVQELTAAGYLKAGFAAAMMRE